MRTVVERPGRRQGAFILMAAALLLAWTVMSVVQDASAAASDFQFTSTSPSAGPSNPGNGFPGVVTCYANGNLVATDCGGTGLPAGLAGGPLIFSARNGAGTQSAVAMGGANKYLTYDAGGASLNIGATSSMYIYNYYTTPLYFDGVTVYQTSGSTQTVTIQTYSDTSQATLVNTKTLSVSDSTPTAVPVTGQTAFKSLVISFPATIVWGANHFLFDTTPPPSATAPGAPVIGTATAGNGQATAAFTAPASDGGSAITGYTVTSNPAGGVDSNAGTTGLSHTVTGLTNGVAYTFTVTATNSVGTSLPSGPSNSVTPMAVTTVSLNSGPNPSLAGQSLTLTAVVSGGPPAPTGTVTFYDGASSIGSVALNSFGVATLSTSLLSPGTHPLSAVYGGDGANNPSTSPSLPQVVNYLASGVVLSSNVNPAAFGAAVTLTANIGGTAPTPTGTVTFYDGASSLGSAAVGPSGFATFITSSLSVGTHVLTAAYSGDGAYAAATSAPLSQGMSVAPTTTTISVGAAAAALGTAVTVRASVVSAPAGSSPPTGTVTFFDGNTALTTAMLSGGAATFTTDRLALGMHQLAAVYSGSDTLQGSSSAPLTVEVYIPWNGSLPPLAPPASPPAAPPRVAPTTPPAADPPPTITPCAGSCLERVAAAGDTVIEVSNAGQFAAGDAVVINAGQANQEYNAVVNLNPFTLATPLKSAHSIGEQVAKAAAAPPSAPSGPPEAARPTPLPPAAGGGAGGGPGTPLPILGLGLLGLSAAGWGALRRRARRT